MGTDLLTSAFPLMLRGLWLTIQVSCGAILIGTVFGALMGIVTCERIRAPILHQVVRGYITIVRGTPVFIQLLIVYFALPYAVGIELSATTAGITTLGLNSAAYLAETLRGGINSLPLGQWEAAQTLGYSHVQTLGGIILPQAVQNLFPALTNELIALIKESSILLILGVPELTKVSKDLVANTLQPMEIYGLTAALYFALTYSLHCLSKRLEKRWGRS